MSARFCDGPRHAGHADTIGKIIAAADKERHSCAALIAADGASYGPVMAAYTLPKDTAEQRAVRSAAITAALVTAAGPPAEVIAAAGRLLGLAQTLQPMVNRSIVPDVAAAVEAIRAAAGTSRANIEANLAGMTDFASREHLNEVIAGVDALDAAACQVIADVRARYA
jgi:methenyltetrahydrofolate cyclohydrolase